MPVSSGNDVMVSGPCVLFSSQDGLLFALFCWNAFLSTGTLERHVLVFTVFWFAPSYTVENTAPSSLSDVSCPCRRAKARKQGRPGSPWLLR